MKKPSPVELEDAGMDTVSGGSGDFVYTCPKCRKTMPTNKCPHCGNVIIIVQPWFH